MFSCSVRYVLLTLYPFSSPPPAGLFSLSLPVRHTVWRRCLEKRKQPSEQSTMNCKRKIVAVSLLTPFSLWFHKLKLSGNNFLIDRLTATSSGTEGVERKDDVTSFVGQVRVNIVSRYYIPNIRITIICPYFNRLYRSCTCEIKENNLRLRNLSLLLLQSGEIIRRSFLCLISDSNWPPFEYFLGSLLLMVSHHIESRNIWDAIEKKRRKFKIRAMD